MRDFEPAQYWDGVEDPSQISGTSRFISGGIGGLTSQLSIYPIETVKVRGFDQLLQRPII